MTGTTASGPATASSGPKTSSDSVSFPSHSSAVVAKSAGSASRPPAWLATRVSTPAVAAEVTDLTEGMRGGASTHDEVVDPTGSGDERPEASYVPVLGQIAAEMLGLPPDRVTTVLGDSDLPPSIGSGGSRGAASSGSSGTMISGGGKSPPSP